MEPNKEKLDKTKITNNEQFELAQNKDIESKKIKRVVSYILPIFISLSLGIFIGRTYDADLNSTEQNTTRFRLTGDVFGEDADIEDLDFNLFWSVWNTMKTNYVDSDIATEEDMFYGAVKGLVDSYGDPATVFLDPEETDLYNDSISGNYFSGIGAELGYRDGQIVVISPIKGSPAIDAGVRAGDIISAVDGVDILPTDSIYDIVMKIRGEKGTDVKITVYHPGQTSPTDITITRGEITIPSMDFEVSEIDSNYAIFDISRFTESTLGEWNETWDQMVQTYLDGNYKGLIIDLRANPGGYLNAAVYAANDFLEKGKIVYQLENRAGEISEFKVTRKGNLLDVPVVILVNEGSASASEIFSGALQLNDRAKVVGVPTYGKGTAQEILDLNDGSTLHITVLKWLLPDGSWLNHDNNIVPDFEVEFTEEDFISGSDPQMEKAIDVIKDL